MEEKKNARRRWKNKGHAHKGEEGRGWEIEWDGKKICIAKNVLYQ